MERAIEAGRATLVHLAGGHHGPGSVGVAMSLFTPTSCIIQHHNKLVVKVDLASAGSVIPIRDGGGSL